MTFEEIRDKLLNSKLPVYQKETENQLGYRVNFGVGPHNHLMLVRRPDGTTPLVLISNGEMTVSFLVDNVDHFDIDQDGEKIPCLITIQVGKTHYTLTVMGDVVENT